MNYLQIPNIKSCQILLERRGMAIPMVLGLIVVSGILGTSIWMSGLVGTARVKHSTEFLQLINLAEAGISSGYARLKYKVSSGIPLEKINIIYFKNEIPMKKAKGIYEGDVKAIGKGKFRIISTGTIKSSNRKLKRSKTMKLSAVAKVRVSLVTDSYDTSKLIRHYKCSLSKIKREEN